MSKFTRACFRKLVAEGLVVGLFATMLTGCGNADIVDRNQAGVTGSEETVWVDYDAIYRESETVNVLDCIWNLDDTVTKPDYYMSLTKYDGSVYENHETVLPFFRGSTVDGDKIYTMRVYYSETGEVNELGNLLYKSDYYLDVLDTDSLEVNTIQYDDDSYAYAIAVSSGRCVSFIDDRDADGYVISSNIIEYMPDGTVSVLGDFYPILEQAGKIPEANWAITGDIKFNSYANEVYFISDDQSCMYITDLNCSYIICFDGLSDNSETISYLCNTYEGIPLFWSYDNIDKLARVFWLENGEARVLFETEHMNIYYDSSMDSKGNLIYRVNDTILSWNVKNGKEERIVIGNSETFNALSGVARNTNGEVITVSCDENTLRKYSFSGVAQTVTIRVDGVSFIGYEARQFFTEYENTHPGVKFDIVSDSEIEGSDYNIRANQIFTDMANGAGPDIVFMYNEIYRKYADTGCLMDLSEVFTDEKRAEIMPQLLEIGAIDGKQYAVYSAYDMGLIVTNQDTWNKDTWTISDVLQLIEDRKKAGNPFEYLQVYEYGCVGYPLTLFMRDMENCEWIDYDNGTCNFDNDEFKKVLEVCKEYNPTYLNQISADDIQQAMKDGRVLCEISSGSFISFSNVMADSNSEDVVVGWPTTTGQGTIIMGGTALVVNKNTEHYDIIKDFINCMYSYDYMGQTSFEIPYSINLYDDKVYTPNMPGCEWADSPYIRLDSHTSRPIKGKPNGDSYLPEYKEVLANARAEKWQEDEISRIIYEEVDCYFNSDTISLQETVNCIQSRVSLYMAENFG